MYPLYAEVDKKLITEQIRNKIVEAHFDYFYELYDFIVNDNENLELGMLKDKFVARIRNITNRIKRK